MIMEGMVFDIRRFSVHDGPGIRSTIFLKGCPLSCCWCHNPESRSALPETSIKVLKLEGRMFKEPEVTGKWMTINEILDEIEKDRIFYDESGGGITISGGEPTFQNKFLVALLKELKSGGFHVALDTCGYTAWDNLASTMDTVDLYLYDLKIMNEDRHLKYTGVSNKLILNNLQLLIRSGKKIIIRVPVIPGINDSKEEFIALKSYLSGMITMVKEVDLLPFHAAAENKYKRFRIDNFMKGIKSTPKEALVGMKIALEEMGFTVRIGG